MLSFPETDFSISAFAGMLDSRDPDGDGVPGTGSSEDLDPIPSLAEWESTISGSDVEGLAERWADGTVWRDEFYDPDFCWRYVRDYLNAGTGSIYHSAHIVTRDEYISYIEGNNGQTKVYNAYPLGLYHNYIEDGHQASLDALRLMADRAWGNYHGWDATAGDYDDGVHWHIHRSRECAYSLHCLLYLEEAVGRSNMQLTSGNKGGLPNADDPASRYDISLRKLEEHLYQWRYQDFSGTSYDEPDREFVSPFMAGLSGYILARHIEINGNEFWAATHWDTPIEALVDLFGWLFEDALDENSNPMWDWYVESAEEKGWRYRNFNGTDVQIDWIMLVAPVYAFIGQQLKQKKWIDYADEQFDNYVRAWGPWGSAYKQFNQGTIWTPDYFRWRGMF